MHGRLRLALVATLATVLVVGVGSLLRSPRDQPDPAPSSSAPVHLRDLDTRMLTGRRTDFCDVVDPAAVTAALAVRDGDEATAHSYRNGQRAQLTDTLTDVAHEYGCTWESPDGVRARAWVFAPPVTRTMASALARAQRADRGCRPVDDAQRYGRSTVAQVCTSVRGRLGTYRGLFGDAWLTCTLTVPGADDAQVAARLDPWCAAVAVADTSAPAG